MSEAKWQWMDDAYGPMGWFTEEEKQQHANGFTGHTGHFRQLTAQEIESMRKSTGRLAYEQS